MKRLSKSRLRTPQSMKISLHREGMISDERMDDFKAEKIGTRGYIACFVGLTIRGVIWEQSVL
jgi:hypothetical protein